jgi:2-polyprenyl-3-methyl-5-hydroxy-6-metoxy-1,4-benzoquinol methylase
MSEISGYYDNFAKSAMLSYRIVGNQRIAKTAALVSGYLQERSRVLEVGCGIGILTELMGRQSRLGLVHGLDLSAQAIDYARKTVRLPNVKFLLGDVIDGQPALAQALKQVKFDALVCAEVIEHIPLEKHEAMFTFLGTFLENNAIIILTYPHPEATLWNRRHRAEVLQPIDEVIHLEDILKIAQILKARLVKYEEITVWEKYQYVHVVMTREPWAHTPLNSKGAPLILSMPKGLRQLYHIWKYIYLPFKDLTMVKAALKSFIFDKIRPPG